MTGTELIAWVSLGVMIIANIVAMILTTNKTSNAQGKIEGAMSALITGVQATVTNLPCVKNSDYMQNMGSLNTKVDGLGDRMGRMENEFNSLSKRFNDYINGKS